MTAGFDATAIERHGWRQGSVLDSKLLALSREFAPKGIDVRADDWLIVTSHDCDVVNFSLEKEPVVEVLRFAVVQRKSPDKQQVWGRNPRVLELERDDGKQGTQVLCARVHERWNLPRELLQTETPARQLDDKSRRLIAEWLAKRYIRAAFPSAFDQRWRSELRSWTKLLATQSQWIQGVYLRLNTLAELTSKQDYKVHFIVAAPADSTKDESWRDKRNDIERLISKFWEQFEPGIHLDGVEVLTTEELTLADIETYQRFDADWVSFADDSPATPASADMLR